MKKEIIISKLTDIFKEVFNDSELCLCEDMTASDVDGWDSLTHMLMISELETAFSIRFGLNDLNRMNTVGDIIAIIEEKTNDIR